MDVDDCVIDAMDMESATVAANGFRYRIPTATMLAVSDKPLHARPKLSTDAKDFYAASRRQHVEIAISVARKVSQLCFRHGSGRRFVRLDMTPHSVGRAHPFTSSHRRGAS